MVLKLHFQQYFRYIVAVSFYWWRKLEKTTDLSQVTDKLYHLVLYQVLLAIIAEFSALQ